MTLAMNQSEAQHVPRKNVACAAFWVEQLITILDSFHCVVVPLLIRRIIAAMMTLATEMSESLSLSLYI